MIARLNFEIGLFGQKTYKEKNVQKIKMIQKSLILGKTEKVEVNQKQLKHKKA